MFFALFILMLLYVSCLGLLCGAVLPPFFYGARRCFALFLNVLGFTLCVPALSFLGMASAAEPPVVVLSVALFFLAVEALVMAIRWFWLRVVATPFPQR